MILYHLWTLPLFCLLYMQRTEEVNSINAIVSLWSTPEVHLPPVQRKWCCILLFAQLPFPLIIFGPWDGGWCKLCVDSSAISNLSSFSTLGWMPSHSHGQFIQKDLFSRGYQCFCTIKCVSDEDPWHGLIISLSKLQLWEQCRYNHLFIRK